MNAYNAVCEVEGLGTWNVLVSYTSPVLATNGLYVIALKDAASSITTAKHVNMWLRKFAPMYRYCDIKKALEKCGFNPTCVNECTPCTAPISWLFDLMPLKPCKSFYNGVYYIEKGVGPWSRVKC